LADGFGLLVGRRIGAMKCCLGDAEGSGQVKRLDFPEKSLLLLLFLLPRRIVPLFVLIYTV